MRDCQFYKPGTYVALDGVLALGSLHHQIVDDIRPWPASLPRVRAGCVTVPLRREEVERLSLRGDQEGGVLRQSLHEKRSLRRTTSTAERCLWSLAAMEVAPVRGLRSQVQGRGVGEWGGLCVESGQPQAWA